MLFNSYIFIFVFLPIVLYLYFLKFRLKNTQRNLILLFASLFFYSWWNIYYLPLLLSSIVINFIIAKFILQKSTQNNSRNLLIFGILINIAFLAYFKYADFLYENLSYIFNLDYSKLNIVLPLAISFFTFQQIAFLIDSYQGKIRSISFIDYSLFVSFFPQLIAGPIVHFREMVPQYNDIKAKLVQHKNLIIGLFLFSIGLFKKVAIADSFSIYVEDGYASPENLNFFSAWLLTFQYSFQLYFDFSGYVDMAIGSALMFNINLPINFNSPYKARNIQDFWRRWHITLSNFLKDYLYIPLGGSRSGSHYTNLLLTFLIGGFWHGAGLNFIFWGFLHGLGLIIFNIFQALGLRLNRFIAILITFLYVNFAFIFFRAETFDSALKVLDKMFTLSHIEMLDPIQLVTILLGSIIIWGTRNSNEIINNLKKSQNLGKKYFAYIVFLFICSLMLLQNKSVFLYYEF